MGLYQVAAILGYSIVFAAAIGLVRMKDILSSYRPFLFIVWLAYINHSLSLILVYYFQSNTTNGNIFVLIESLLYLLLFRNWGAFSAGKKLFIGFFISLIIVWVIDNLLMHNLKSANSGFRVISSFLLLLLAIDQLIVLITKTKSNLLYNPVFIICSGMLIYFSYKATIEVFFLVEATSNLDLIINIYTVLVYINCFVNLLFAWAVIWIPKKKQFTYLH